MVMGLGLGLRLRLGMGMGTQPGEMSLAWLGLACDWKTILSGLNSIDSPEAARLTPSWNIKLFQFL